MDLPALDVPAPRSLDARPAHPRHRAHKFGGSSVADADRYRHVAALLHDAPQPRVVVVSAMQGVTDALTALAGDAAAGRDWQNAWSRLRDQHLATVYRLDGSVQMLATPENGGASTGNNSIAAESRSCVEAGA